MDAPDRRMVVVHAHPDDECISTGGILARYAAEGAGVTLVTCTNGEVGEMYDLPEFGGDPESFRHKLAEIRNSELMDACEVLGVSDVRLLGYHDSGMEGTQTNEDPQAFVNQDLLEVTGRLVAIFREARPQVVITYNEIGFYGHPDHIRCNHATLAAMNASADPQAYPEAGEPWLVDKLYYTAIPRSRLERAHELFGTDEEHRFDPEEIERLSTSDELVTTAVDVSGFIEAKFKALEAHRTQLGTTQWFLSIPSELREMAFGVEHFVRVRPSGVPGAPIEDDLFAAP